VELNDNVNFSQVNPQEDLIHGPGVRIEAVWPVTSTSALLSFASSLSYAKYLRNSQYDRYIISPDSEFALDVPVENIVFTLYDRFFYSQDVLDLGELSGVAEFSGLNNTVGLKATWLPEDWLVLVDYGHFNFFSSSTIYSYLERSSERFFGRSAYIFTPELKGGLEASGSLTDYRQTVRNDNYSYSIGGFIKRRAGEAFLIEGRVGYVGYAFEESGSSPPTDDLNSWYVSLDGSHHINQFLTHSLSASRRIDPGIQSDYIERYLVRYQIRSDFSRYGTLSFGLFYEHGEESPSALAEEFDRIGINGAISYDILKSVSLRLAYEFTLKDSEVFLDDYRQNSLSLSVSWRF
jgi:hypothetical protein